MNFFLALSFAHRKQLDSIVNEIKRTLEAKGHSLTIFVDKQFTREPSSTQLMTEALTLLQSADVLIAETSTKQPGVALEIGAAYALNKPIIALRKKGSEPSKTIEGVTDTLIEYSDEEPIEQSLSRELDLLKIKSSKKLKPVAVSLPSREGKG